MGDANTLRHNFSLTENSGSNPTWSALWSAQNAGGRTGVWETEEGVLFPARYVSADSRHCLPLSLGNGVSWVSCPEPQPPPLPTTTQEHSHSLSHPHPSSCNWVRVAHAWLPSKELKRYPSPHSTPQLPSQPTRPESLIPPAPCVRPSLLPMKIMAGRPRSGIEIGVFQIALGRPSESAGVRQNDLSRGLAAKWCEATRAKKLQPNTELNRDER